MFSEGVTIAAILEGCSWKLVTINTWASHFLLGALIASLMKEDAKGKTGMNSVWNGFINNRKIPYFFKLEVYNSIFRSTLSYGAQV